MNRIENLVAIGRSRYLYDSVEHLVSAGFCCKAIITDEAYEEYDIKPAHFQNLANKIGARYFHHRDLAPDELAEIVRSNEIKLAISANWKYKLSPQFLQLFKYGVLNFHLGNLPDYKGNATVNWSILNGEYFINANIHKMDVEFDAGDIIARQQIPITGDCYIESVLKEAEKIAPLIFEKALNLLLANPAACEEKGSINGSRCYPRFPEDSQIDWQDDAVNIHRLVRASAHPYKGAFTYLNDEKIIIWKASPYDTNEVALAVPGHVISVQKETGNIVIACKRGLLKLEEVEYKSVRMLPAELIRSIRTRFKFKSNV